MLSSYGTCLKTDRCNEDSNATQHFSTPFVRIVGRNLSDRKHCTTVKAQVFATSKNYV